MKMNTQRIRMAVMLLLCVLLVPLSLQAQNVTVHPGNGSMLPAKKNTTQQNGDTFFRWRGFATWKHEQLSLTMTVGDSDNNLTNSSNGLTSNGQLQNPANNLFATPSNTTGAARYLQIGKGNGMDTYVTVVLPKGYRFTGYTITFHRINYPTSDGIRYQSSNGWNSYKRIYWTQDNGNETYSDLNETTAAISFGETDNTFTYTSTTNTTDNNKTTYRGNIAQNTTTQYTIGRTSQTATDMTNVLYFKLSNNESSGRAFIMLDKMELEFTAEYNTPTLIPAQTANGVSAVDIPFTTGKVDYDVLENRTDGVTRISYNGTIRDMNAYMTLYEKGSVETVSDNGFDGTAGDIVKYQSGSISSAGDYFKLESSLHPKFKDDGEAIYYIESPIWATNSATANAHKNPIGYRIVSATFNYEAGSGEVYLPATFKIQYESTGHGPDQDGTYGLNVYSGTYNWNPSYHTVWRIDQDGYIYGYNTGNNTTYYLAVDGLNISMTTTQPTAANGTFEVVNNQIRLKSNTNQYIGWQETVNGTYVDGNGETNDNVTRYFVIAADEAHRSTYVELSAATIGTHGDYVFKIYGPDGETVAKTINVSEEGGSVTVTGYNNDAIKIGIIGTGLINGEITMQALDPYIDRLDVICQESGGTGGKLTQPLTAQDFAVKGGKFTFYVPEGFPAPAKFTFDNLYSHYGDSTYYGNTSSTNHARYFFVESPYAQTNDNVYNRNNEASYTTKILTALKGNTSYKFNNASTVSTTGGYFEEYPFSTTLYAAQTPSGTFEELTFNATEMANGTQKTAYLFTCDEPRYNIAPTTATQHVYYAFYKMTIDMGQKTYVPVLEWTKLYDTTFDGGGKTDSKWGLKLTTTETVDDHGSHSGYLTVSQILDKIGERTGNNTVEGGPENTDQILYIDGSKLMSIVENQTATTSGGTTTYTPHSTSELKAILDKNALIYLPYGSRSSNDNFAFNTEEDYSKTPSFHGANDIVLTDKYAFYAPYDIQVDAAKSTKYIREKSKSSYSTVNTATAILPFEMLLEDGQHNNTYGGSTLKIRQMQNNSSITTAADGKPWAYFPQAYADATENIPAYKPFLIEVVENPDTLTAGSFEIIQRGSRVKATPASQTIGDYKYLYVGESSTGTVKAGEGGPDAESAGTFTFTNYGTIAGITIPQTDAVFYFAQGRFLNSSTLGSSANGTVKILPFRSFYTTSPTAKTAKFSTLDIILGEGLGDEPDAIRELKQAADLGVKAGHGTLTIASKVDNNVRINGVNGIARYNFDMKAGEVKTVNVPAGVYVINGVKILVK